MKIDPRLILSSILDGSKFHEFKKMYGEGLVCGYGRMDGHLVGIVANNGNFDADAAKKGAHFVHMTTDRRIPIVFLQNSLFHEDFETPESYEKSILSSSETTRARASFIAAVAVSKVGSYENAL